MKGLRVALGTVLPLSAVLHARSSVPPSRSVFPDYGPYTDFFEEIGPDLVRILCEKSDSLSMILGMVNSAALPAIK